MSSLRSFRTTLHVPRSRAFTPHHLAANYHILSPLRTPYKDDQSRSSLKPKSTEGSKSGTDQGVAETNTAFDPSTTRPEEEKNEAGKGKRGNPLGVSGADRKSSLPLGEEGGGEMKGTTRIKGGKE